MDKIFSRCCILGTNFSARTPLTIKINRLGSLTPCPRNRRHSSCLSNSTASGLISRILVQNSLFISSWILASSQTIWSDVDCAIRSVRKFTQKLLCQEVVYNVRNIDCVTNRFARQTIEWNSFFSFTNTWHSDLLQCKKAPQKMLFFHAAKSRWRHPYISSFCRKAK